jgi:hypothetical protein
MSKDIMKWSRKHDAMVDFVLANPTVKLSDMAMQFGYTPQWMGVIVASERFKSKLQDRREEVVDPILMATLEDKLKAVLDRAVEVVAEKLQKDADQISDQFVMRAAEFGAKSLGLGVKGSGEKPEHEPDHLEDLARRLVTLNRTQGAQDVAYIESAQAGEADQAAGGKAGGG